MPNLVYFTPKLFKTLIKSSKLKNYTARQNRKRVNYDQSLLDDRHHGFELSRSVDRHSYFVYPHDSENVVVQFYPWFKFYFLLFWVMVIYDSEFETKEIEI